MAVYGVLVSDFGPKLFFKAKVIEPGLFIIRPGHGPCICLTRQVWVAHRSRHGDMLDFEALEQVDLTEYDLE